MVAIREGDRDEADRPYLFRSYDHVEAAPTKYDQFDVAEMNPGRVQRNKTRIWEACRATSAAPFYFNKATIVGVRYMDGGVGEGANNPAGYALNEALQMADRQGKLQEIAALISVGTGQKKAQSRFGNRLALMRWARKVITDTGKAHTEVQTRLNGKRTPYFRFDVRPRAGSNDPGLSKTRLNECKWKKRKADKKGKAKDQDNDDDHHQDGTLSADLPGAMVPIRAMGQASDRSPRKPSFDPEKYVYITYDKIQRLTDEYCAHNKSSIQVENINAYLQKAAQILVWYRRRREAESPMAWSRFSQHPYTNHLGS